MNGGGATPINRIVNAVGLRHVKCKETEEKGRHMLYWYYLLHCYHSFRYPIVYNLNVQVAQLFGIARDAARSAPT